MAARTTWRGALAFAGFPINVAAYAVTKSRSAESFKMLGADGLPVKQQLVDTSGTVVERADTQRGVEVSKGKFAVLPPAAIEAINEAEKSKTCEPAGFPALDTVPPLSKQAYRLTPDEKVPGADQGYGILWNGLRASGRALIVDGWKATSSSRPTLLAIHADDEGLIANALPYSGELNDVPTADVEEDAAKAAMFQQFLDTVYADETGPFDLTAFTDTYAETRKEIVAKALAGEVIEAPQAPAGAASGPDLMAAMTAALEQSKSTKRKGGTKKPAAKKAKAPA